MGQSCGCRRGHRHASTNVRVDETNIDDVCTAWAQEKYGSKYKVVSVNTSDLKVIEDKITYKEKKRNENQSVKRSARTYVNRLDIPVEQEFSDQSTNKYTCVWTKTKGHQLSGGLSVNVGLPESVGLSAKIGGQLNLSNTETRTSGQDETAGQVTRLQQPPRSTLLAEIKTTENVITMPYSLTFHLQGNISFVLEKKSGATKVKSVDVTELYHAFGGHVAKGAGGKTKSIQLANEGTLETSIEVHQVVEMKEPDAEKVMKLIHKDLLNDNREKIVEQVSDNQALQSKLEKAMSLEKVVSEEQLKTVREDVNNLVGVLENAEPEKFLAFVDILQREGYSELVELLDPRGVYPDSVKHISNLSGVVDHYFVTKKESEVRNSLESARGAILHGMPGSGKTQLAYKVAGDYARVHPHSVVWVIDGSSEEKLKAEIANLQQRLSGETNVDNSLFQRLVSRWKHFLLLINDLSPTVAIPTQVLSSSAKMIVTTQDSLRNLKDVDKIPIEGFTEDEAVAFLSPQMPTGTSTEQMRDLANIFSCLPLGLAAARASIHRGKMTVEEYKRQLQDEREALEALMNRENNWLQQHYKKEHQEAARNIFAALQLAIDRLDDPRTDDPGEEKMCKVMLQPCAFLEPNNIPVLMLKSALKSSPKIGSDAHFAEGMRMYSLGSIEGEGVKRRLSIHSVTQMAVRLHMDREQQTTPCINKLLQILVKFFCKDMMTYSEMHKFSLELMPHVEAVLKHADKLELGLEYPLMKARLLMVYGHLLIQKGTPASSQKHLEEAWKLLLQFAGIPEDILSTQSVEEARKQFAGIPEVCQERHTWKQFADMWLQTVSFFLPHLDSDLDHFHLQTLLRQREKFQDYGSKELYRSLVDKSQSLEDNFFQETVIKRVITKHNLRALSPSDKLSAEDRTTLEKMVENFEPLTMEMYKRLVDNKLAIPIMELKKIFLPEMFITIMYLLGKTLLGKVDGYSRGLVVDMCTNVTNETGVVVLVHFLADSDFLCTLMVRDKFTESIPNKVVKSLILQLTKTYAATQYYDFGLLTSLGGDTFLMLNYYENVTNCCISNAFVSKAAGKKTGLISLGQETCKRMLGLVESESQAGNPPLKLAAYYITAGLFNVRVDELKLAAEMFWKAYRVELKREEYHPRMREALLGLIQARIAQKELGTARVCARRLLQLALDHWPAQVQECEHILKRICCEIIIQARRIKKEKEKAVYENVTTV